MTASATRRGRAGIRRRLGGALVFVIRLEGGRAARLFSLTAMEGGERGVGFPKPAQQQAGHEGATIVGGRADIVDRFARCRTSSEAYRTASGVHMPVKRHESNADRGPVFMPKDEELRGGLP